jgi:hypothetical protein
MADAQRLQLHSVVNDAAYWFVLILFWFGLACSLFWLPLELCRSEPEPAILIMPVETLVFLLLALWARRRRTRVFATICGLELGAQRSLVPWARLKAVENLSPLGGLLVPLYRLTFSDDTPAVTFYAREDVEAVVQRFQH